MYYTLQDLFEPLLSLGHKVDKGRLTTFVRVEAGLRLLEVLGLQDHSILTIWALNQGIEVPALHALKLNTFQRRWLSNFRVTNHRSSRRDWIDDFGFYAQMPEAQRLYAIPDDATDLQTIVVKRTGCQDARAKIYDQVLGNVLPFKVDKRKFAEAKKYAFAYSREYRGEVVFQKKIIEEAQKHKLARLTRKRSRKAIQFTHSHLRALAQEVDARELELGMSQPGSWTERVDRIVRYRGKLPNGELAEANSMPIRIDGMTHLAGMVGSGKSTIATLIAYDIARHKKGQRVTLVVADVAEAMRLTEYFNTILATSKAFAVPLLGPSQREKHLLGIFRQKNFSIAVDKWKSRFLDTTCLVTNWLAPIDDTAVAETKIGQEPCSSLYKAEDRGERKKYHLCPLFSICPVQQVYRDMPDAPIWITTIGGLSQAKVPAQVDVRRPPLWLTIYENSTVVIFDEVDIIQDWLDRLFSPALILDDKVGGGLMQDALRKLASHPSGTFRRNTEIEQWRQGYDLTMPALRNLLGLLEGEHLLQTWIGNYHFTSLKIFVDLASRISGRIVWKEDEDVPVEVVDLYTRLRALFLEFHQSRLSLSDRDRTGDINELSALSTEIVLNGRAHINPTANKLALEWIKKQIAVIPRSLRKEIAEKAKEHARTALQRAARSKQSIEDPEIYNPVTNTRLVRHLEFGLLASILDRRLRRLFYGWHAAQQVIGDEGLPSYIPTSLSGLVPVPPLGNWRGFRSDKADETSESLSLGVFEFAGVGRHFVQKFDRLLEDMDGLPGPHVLAMSGTSWMPDSSRFHFDIPVAGVLEPEKDIQDAIRKSTFTYLPQTPPSEKNVRKKAEPIRVSGTPDIDQNLRQLSVLLSRIPNNDLAPLPAEMAILDQLSKEREEWDDRARILLMVNSYTQAHRVADVLRSSLRRDLAEDVYAVAPSDDAVKDEWDWRIYRTIKRSEVEASGHLARILVAPISAIGRGYNIISPKTRRAAYGSIYFLIRPMTPPFDLATMVAGINHKLDGWLRPENPVWNECDPQTPLAQISFLRKRATEAWQVFEEGSKFRYMDADGKKELGATTASTIIQACGRLLRGGVPFRAYFVDAAWVNGIEMDGEFLARPKESLLAAMIERLLHYTSDPVGAALYGAFSDGLQHPERVNLDLSVY